MVAVVVHLVVLYAPSAPGPDVGLPHVDKAVHLAVFAAVALPGVLAGLPARPLVGGLLVHAVASEVVQHLLLPGRLGDPGDVAANAAGTLLGAAAALALRRRDRPGT